MPRVTSPSISCCRGVSALLDPVRFAFTEWDAASVIDYVQNMCKLPRHIKQNRNFPDLSIGRMRRVTYSTRIGPCVVRMIVRNPSNPGTARRRSNTGYPWVEPQSRQAMRRSLISSGIAACQKRLNGRSSSRLSARRRGGRKAPRSLAKWEPARVCNYSKG